MKGVNHRGFPRPNLGPIIGLYPIKKNGQKLPKIVYIIPNFLALHFGENFMKIRTKIQKLKLHENLHEKCECTFSFTFLCKFSPSFSYGPLKQQICDSFTLLYFLYGL